MKPNTPGQPLTKKTLAWIFIGCYAFALLLFVCFLIAFSTWVSVPSSTIPTSTPAPGVTTPLPPAFLSNPSPPDDSSTLYFIVRALVIFGIFFSLLGFAAGPFAIWMWRNRGMAINIPENYGAVLFVHGRKKLVVQGQSFKIQPDQGHELQFFSLREQSRSIQHTCDTADQLRVNLDIEMRWQHVADTMFLFLNSTDDPPSAIEKSVKAELTSQINKNDYQSAMKTLKIIAMRVTTAAQIKAAQYGLQVNSVNINSAKIDAATSPAREEASRINALNDAVNKASEKTLDYVLKTKDDKKDDKKKE